MSEAVTLIIGHVMEKQPLWFDQTFVTALAIPLSCIGMYDSNVGDAFCDLGRGGVSSSSFQSAVPVPTTKGAENVTMDPLL